MQNNIMNFDPALGTPKPYPSHAEQWRQYHGAAAWLFNPWGDGKARRDARDVGSDPFGLLIAPQGEALVACSTEAAPKKAGIVSVGDCVIDHDCGLMWTTATLTDKCVNHETAMKVAADCRLRGFTDWRLPTIKELQTLVDFDKRKPAIDTALFPDTKSDWYWSSSLLAGVPFYAWCVGFNGGRAFYDRRAYSLGFVRAVRSVAPASPGQ